MKIKDIISIFIIVLMTTTFFLPVIGAEGEPSVFIEVSNPAPKAGDVITVTVGIENNPGIWSFAFEMPVDTSIFEFISADTSQSILNRCAFSAYDESTSSYKYNAYNSDLFNNINDNGILATITLKVKDDIETGTHYISCIPNDDNIINVEDQNVTFKSSSHPINVEGNEPKAQSNIVAAEIVLGKTVKVNYYAKLDNAHTSAQMRFTVNGKETIVSSSPSPNNNYEYVYTLENIEYCNYDCNIKAELILEESILDTKEEYSIKEYCERMQNKTTDSSLNKLLSALLEYGEALKSSGIDNESIKISSENYKAAVNEYVRK